MGLTGTSFLEAFFMGGWDNGPAMTRFGISPKTGGAQFCLPRPAHACHGAICVTMMARHSSLMVESCRACAEACHRCAEDCASGTSHEVMKNCVESCKRCEESCRNMVKAMGGEHHHEHRSE